MNYAVPLYPPNIVNAAGKALKDIAHQLPTGEETLAVINNWRAAHNYPLNALHMTLKQRVRRISTSAITAQRIKRLDSIYAKLMKQKSMHLSQMQDIGGCRAVVPNIGDLDATGRPLSNAAAHSPTGGIQELCDGSEA